MVQCRIYKIVVPRLLKAPFHLKHVFKRSDIIIHYAGGVTQLGDTHVGEVIDVWIAEDIFVDIKW